MKCKKLAIITQSICNNDWAGISATVVMRQRFLVLLVAMSGGLAVDAQDHEHPENHAPAAEAHAGEDFVYHAHEVNYITGQGVNPGGFVFPEIHFTVAGALLEPGASPSDFGSFEHDPRREAGIQVIEPHVGINVNDRITGAIIGVILEEGGEWEATLEEAYLHYHFNDYIAVGGGRFLTRFGWQSEKHVHRWDYVNQNLTNSRFLNEGEWITEGAEVILNHPHQDVVLTLGAGGVLSHAHAHEEGEEHPEDDDEHHLETDGAGLNDWMVSADLKFRLPGDESAQVAVAFATGENGFGENTYVYGFGAEKIWRAHDHGSGADFCEDAVMIRSMFMGRDFDAVDEDGDVLSFGDTGISTSLFYGLSENSTISFRHDWVSGIEALELEDHHRYSSAFSTRLGSNDRILARLQYDYNQNSSYASEHVGWLQFQWQWGGEVGVHNH